MFDKLWASSALCHLKKMKSDPNLELWVHSFTFMHSSKKAQDMSFDKDTVMCSFLLSCPEALQYSSWIRRVLMRKEQKSRPKQLWAVQWDALESPQE